MTDLFRPIRHMIDPEPSTHPDERMHLTIKDIKKNMPEHPDKTAVLMKSTYSSKPNLTKD